MEGEEPPRSTASKVERASGAPGYDGRSSSGAVTAGKARSVGAATIGVSLVAGSDALPMAMDDSASASPSASACPVGNLPSRSLTKALAAHRSTPAPSVGANLDGGGADPVVTAKNSAGSELASKGSLPVSSS